jgi:hypothetical protein
MGPWLLAGRVGIVAVIDHLVGRMTVFRTESAAVRQKPSSLIVGLHGEGKEL